MHDLVRELAIQVSKNICNNISKLQNLLHSTQEAGRHFILYSTILGGFGLDCFGFNGPLRQYFSLYRAVSQREGEREVRG